MDRKRRVLIVDDEQAIHIATKYVLKDKFECVSAYNGDEAKALLQKQSVDVVLLDIHMRKPGEGLEYLPKFRELDPDLDVIIVSSNTELDLAVRAIREGAAAYLLKDHSDEQLLLTIELVLSKRELLHENEHYVRDRKRTLDRNRIIGDSMPMRQLMRDIEKVRRASANVIIFGETGTGKELVARHVGESLGKPFVAVDSATITSSMAESILFGHERGAFTGAAGPAKGLFEEANGGTIYFDEIVNMPLEIQAKLMRVLQEKEVVRLGSTKVIPLAFRAICATNKDLEKLINEGKFKDDLYQRLNVISLRIPALRERPVDIPLLVEHFFEKFRYERSPQKLSDSTMEVLLKYSWPGNIRELSNLIANLCAMVLDQEVVEVEDLPQKVRDGSFRGPKTAPVAVPSVDLPKGGLGGIDFYSYMHSVEGAVLRQLYAAYSGNVSQMSKELKISRSHLYSKLKAFQLI